MHSYNMCISINNKIYLTRKWQTTKRNSMHHMQDKTQPDIKQIIKQINKQDGSFWRGLCSLDTELEKEIERQRNKKLIRHRRNGVCECVSVMHLKLCVWSSKTNVVSYRERSSCWLLFVHTLRTDCQKQINCKQMLAKESIVSFAGHKHLVC